MVTDGNDIVVVDDNPALLTVLSEIFKEHGYTVRTAADGFEALAVIRDREPGILVSDLNMPGMSGFELLSVVRLPVITTIIFGRDSFAEFSSPSASTIPARFSF